MKTIKHAIELPINQTALFDLTQDYKKRLEWDSYLAKAYLMNDAQHPAVGVESFCQNKTGAIMISRYISFHRPDVAAVTMVKGSYILKRFSGAWTVKKIDDQNSLLIFTYNFELKGGLLGKLLLPLISHLFSKDMEKRLIAIKIYIDKKYKKTAYHC